MIPLVLSMRATVSIKNVCVWADTSSRAASARAKAPPEMRTQPPPEFFQPPQDYSLMSLEEKTAEKRSKGKRKSHKKSKGHAGNGAMHVPAAPAAELQADVNEMLGEHEGTEAAHATAQNGHSRSSQNGQILL